MLSLNETPSRDITYHLVREDNPILFAFQVKHEAGASVVTSQSAKISYQKVKRRFSLDVKRWNEEERLNFMIKRDKQKEDQEKKKINMSESQNLAKQDRRVQPKQKQAGMATDPQAMKDKDYLKDIEEKTQKH